MQAKQIFPVLLLFWGQGFFFSRHFLHASSPQKWQFSSFLSENMLAPAEPSPQELHLLHSSFSSLSSSSIGPLRVKRSELRLNKQLTFSDTVILFTFPIYSLYCSAYFSNYVSVRCSMSLKSERLRVDNKSVIVIDFLTVLGGLSTFTDSAIASTLVPI